MSTLGLSPDAHRVGHADTKVHDAIIVGAGFSGIGMSIALDKAGLRDHLLIDEAQDVGGTWKWNHYPGVAVDIPSFSYQFSFAPRSDWSRTYAPGVELLQYARDLAVRHDVNRRARFGRRVARTAWNESEHTWTVTTTTGEVFVARHVVVATGALSQPKMPAIAGLESFAGPVVHTARWDDSLDVTGKRVAIIGTGASSVQVVPALAPLVEHLDVYQRTPIWCLPKPDVAIGAGASAALTRVPALARLARLASQSFVEVSFPLAAHYHSTIRLAGLGEKAGKAYLRRVITDPTLREKLTPQYALGCKRPSFSNTYLPSFERKNVELVTDGIDRIVADGVVTADGSVRPADILVCATGFAAFEDSNMPPFDVDGVDGTLLDRWHTAGYGTHEGFTVPGFPNLFLAFGPYGYNGASYFTLIENQMAQLTRILQQAARRHATRVEVTETATAAHMARMVRRDGKRVFDQPSCVSANSYYFGPNGEVPFRSTTTLEGWWRTRHVPASRYRFEARSVAAPVGAVPKAEQATTGPS